MKNVDEIHGNAVLKLFKELRENGIPLQIQLKHGEYKHLIYLADIRKRRRVYYFLIQSYETFQKTVIDSEDWRLRFEFTGKDNIHHAFETRDGEISRDMIWIKLPEIIYRYQRRIHFRLDAPHGTKLKFNIKDAHYKLLVIDVSLGGTLGVLVSLTKEMERDLRLHKDKSLKDVELLFPAKDDDNDNDSRVNIKKCQIRRQRKNPQTKRYECAMEFTEIAVDQQKKFSALFYQWQRDYLRKRRLLKA